MSVQRAPVSRRIAPAAALFGIALLGLALPVHAADNASKDELLSTFKDVYDRVRASYVEPLDGDKVVASAINGMLTGLDAESGYVDPASMAKHTPDLPGEIPELGLVVTVSDSLVQIVAPLRGGPSANGG